MNTKTKGLPEAQPGAGAADPGASSAASDPGEKKKSAADLVGSDEFTGKGGSYTFDPEAGKRAPTAETVEHLAKHEPKADKKEPS